MKRAHVYDLEEQWETFLGHLRRGCQATRVPFMAPPLPAGFVARRREFDSIRSMLLDPATGDAIATTAALAGAGGVGKTSLACNVCHAENVISAFDDGILWARLGEKPNIQGELTKLYAALTGERPPFVDDDDAAIQLAERLDQKSCLMVIDDVWSANDLKPFLRGGPQCARLVTTRQARVAAECEDVSVDEMTSQEATALLGARIDPAPTDLQPFRKLAHRLGEWPLLLKLANAALRGRLDRGDTLERAVRYVERALDKHGVTAFDRERPADRGDAVASTIAVSLNPPDEADQTRCAELQSSRKTLPFPLQRSKSCGLDDLDAEEVLSRLHDASMIEFDLGAGVVRVHDIMLPALECGSDRRRTRPTRGCSPPGPMSGTCRIPMRGAGSDIISSRRAGRPSCESCCSTSTGCSENCRRPTSIRCSPTFCTCPTITRSSCCRRSCGCRRTCLPGTSRSSRLSSWAG